jgi:choline kinase
VPGKSSYALTRHLKEDLLKVLVRVHGGKFIHRTVEYVLSAIYDDYYVTDDGLDKVIEEVKKFYSNEK